MKFLRMFLDEWKRSREFRIGVIVTCFFTILPFYFQLLKLLSGDSNSYVFLESLLGPIFTSDSIIASVGLFGTCATIGGLVYAVLQTIESKKAVVLLTETKPLVNSQDVLNEFEERIKNTAIPVKNIYLMANTIAIGATGEWSRFQKFEKILSEQISNLKSEFHAAYVKLVFVEQRDSDGQREEKFNGDSFKRLKKFYIEHIKFNETGQLDDIYSSTKTLHRAVKKYEADYRALEHADSTGPHFILFNPDENDRLGIIWNRRIQL
jgi:hypothetical protein